MKDIGIDKGLIQSRDSSSRNQRGWGKNFFGFRKMFWDFLKKLHVPFYDECCEGASEEGGNYPVRYNSNLGRLEYFNGTEWADIIGITETTSTTTTTTIAPTTTTTTIAPSTTTTTTI